MALGTKALMAILALVILSLTMVPTWSMAFLIILGIIASAFNGAIEVTTTIPILPVQDPAPTDDASGDAPVEALALSVDALGLAEDAPALTVDAPVDASGDAPVDAPALLVDALGLAEDAPALTVDAPVDDSAQSSAVVATGIEMRRRWRGDAYKIKQTLRKSDLSQSRLRISGADVATYVLPYMDEERVRQAKSKEGAEVVVWDADTGSEHRLVLAHWPSSDSYILKGGWNEFVERRGLAEGDEIGIHWDPIASKFHFSLLHRRPREKKKEINL